MPPIAQRGLRQRVRRCFRWCRVTVLFFLFLLLGALAYLNCVGLPEFLKARLVAELRARGVVLQFSRMRLRWYHGLVAENVSLGRADDPSGPHLSLAEADLQLDRAALHRLQFHVRSLVLHDGRLVLPLPSADEPPERFVMAHIMTELHLLPGDRWELDHFQAACLGARINVSGTLTNASAVQDWQFRRAANQPAGQWQTQLRQTVRVARQLRFKQPPEILFTLRGDARQPASITADVRIDAGKADTTWGRFDKLQLMAQLNRRSGTNEIGESELRLQLDDAHTPWGHAKLSRLYVNWAQAVTDPMPAEAKLDWDFWDVVTPWGEIPRARFVGRAHPSPDDPLLLRTELMLDSGFFQSEWFNLKTNHFTAQLTHRPWSLLPLRADWQWAVDRPESRWGSAQHLEFNGHAARDPTKVSQRANGLSAWWAALDPYDVDWESRMERVVLTNVVVLDRLTLAGKWRSPQLAIEKLHADLYDHQLDATAQIHVATRETRAQGDFDFDLHKIESLLTPHTRHWLSQFTWTEPPRVGTQVRIILPAWTNTHPDWRAEVLPTLQLEGGFKAGPGEFRGVPISSAQSHFSFSNFVWRLPDFVGTRPEGRFEFAYASDTRKRDYHFQVRGQLDPQGLKPLFGETPPRVFDYFQFHEPPSVEGEIQGQWGDPEKLAFAGQLSATNFVFREVPISDLSAVVSFTNRFLTATEVLIGSGGPQVSASGVGYDLATQSVSMTNAISTMDPKLVTHAIGPQVERVLSPYTFVAPPTALVNGWVEVRRGKQSDLRFDLSGGPFTFWKFIVPHISGAVRWANETVAITNLQADFYRGKLAADMYFDCTAPRAADFNLRAAVANADLHQLMNDVSLRTNRLEGILTGDLTITKANSADWESWNGFGQAQLSDGFLWDMPLFGIFSSVLNAVIPGLGNSPVSGVRATFTITNSVIHTDDMEIRSPAMRLAYRGTIDFKGRVDARVEARLLRDAWVIGPMISLVFAPLTKLFEYKVTGTLHEPQKEPLYIPKPFLFPFHPLRTLKELFIEEKPEKTEPTSPTPNSPLNK